MGNKAKFEYQFVFKCFIDLQPATVLTADNGLPTTHDDVAAENRVPQSDADWQEHSLVTLGTENIWQDHQLLQFKQQVNIWNMMSYRMWETKQQQQHPIPVYWNAWTVANHTSISCAALADNVFICPYPQVHCLEHKSFSVPSHTPFPIHTPNTTPKSTSKSSSEFIFMYYIRINIKNYLNK